MSGETTLNNFRLYYVSRCTHDFVVVIKMLKQVLVKITTRNNLFSSLQLLRINYFIPRNLSVQPDIVSPLNIPKHINDPIFKYIENNHAYKILQGIPEYKYTLYNKSTNVESIQLSKTEFEEILIKNWRSKSATDILEGFKRVSNYARENNVPLSNNCFDKIVDGLMDHCKNLTDDELAELLNIMRKFPVSETLTSHNFQDMWSALDDVCCLRYDKWSIDKLLQFADLWYLLGLLKHIDYTKNCIKRITKKLKVITKPQFVHTLFLINIIRKPIDMFEYECKLEKFVQDLTLEELGIVAMGFFKTRTCIKGTFIIRQIIEKLMEETTTVNEITLSAILKVSSFFKIFRY